MQALVDEVAGVELLVGNPSQSVVATAGSVVVSGHQQARYFVHLVVGQGWTIGP